MIDVTLHDNPAMLGSVRSEWAHANEYTADVDGFAPATLDWYRDALRAEPDVEPRVLVVSIDEAPIAIVPFVLERRTTWLGMTIGLLRFANGPRGTRCTIPGPHPGTGLAAALRWLAARDEWDVLRLDDPARRTRVRTALRIARMTFDWRRVEARTQHEGPPITRMHLFEDEQHRFDGPTGDRLVAERYVAWRTSSPRTWLAARDAALVSRLCEGGLTVELATESSEPSHPRLAIAGG